MSVICEVLVTCLLHENDEIIIFGYAKDHYKSNLVRDFIIINIDYL